MNAVQEIEIRTYSNREGHTPFLEWFDALHDELAKARILARLARIRLGNLGDHKILAGGIHELRLFFGPGYRIHFAREGQTIILLLTGGSKGTQRRDIRKALEYYKDYMERENE